MIKDLPTIIPGLSLIPGENNGRFPLSHAFMVRGEVDALIDAGCGRAVLRQLRRGWLPQVVVASHAHPDHCSGLWLFPDAAIISPVQYADIFWRYEPLSRRLVEPGELARLWCDYVREAMGIREVSADDHFDDGHVFDFGKIKLHALHAPGHLDDHYVFWEPQHGVALTFDIDLTSFGPWYGHRESDIDLFLDSIQKVIDLKPKILVSSHKGIITEDIAGRLRAYAAVFDRRDELLLELLHAPKSLAGLVDASPFYRGHPYAPEIMRYWEGNMIEKHLQRMEKKGRVEQSGDAWQKA